MTWQDWKGKTPIWCAGCGDFGVLTAMQKTAEAMKLNPETTVLATGIGCSGSVTAYFRSFGIHGIHGRSLPLATGVKMANPDLTVLVAGGDGDGFGIGLGHFMHAARRNVDVTYIVMDNQVYGLTKGQTSPTTPTTMTTKASPMGPMAVPLSPLAVALTGGATYVAQAFSGNQAQLIELLSGAIRHKGFSFVNIQSPCVTYNHINTYDWFRTNMRDLASEGHDHRDLAEAYKVAQDNSTVPMGLLYQTTRPSLQETAHPWPADEGAVSAVRTAFDAATSHSASAAAFAGWSMEFQMR